MMRVSSARIKPYVFTAAFLSDCRRSQTCESISVSIRWPFFAMPI